MRSARTMRGLFPQAGARRRRRDRRPCTPL